MKTGTKVVLTGVTVEVLASTPEGIASEASFRFDQPADADAYLWQRWDGSRLVTVKPPRIGEHVTIPGQCARFF
jgi:hypothetical protein